MKRRLKLIKKRLLHRTRIHFKYLFRKREVREPLFIIATRRSGSNFLLSLLNSVPAVEMAAEILNPDMYYGLRWSGLSKKAVLRHIRHSIYDGDQAVCGAKLLMFQMEAHGVTVEDVRSLFPKARFIILYRRSLFDQFVSLKIAEGSGIWQSTDETPLPQSLRVDTEEYRAFCSTIRSYYGDLLRHAWLRECSIMVDYESLVESPQGIFNAMIFPFLRLPVSKVSSALRKQNRQGHALVQNYNEVLALLGQEHYAILRMAAL
ncbi:MAG: sulfotransferase domain-containing protein [Candidatus Omnitrophica bacterium]|nr:sulfotransferase domain-containing protein [Candidatus Omnitrophota bacterium]